MKAAIIPIQYWVLGIILALPFLSFFAVTYLINIPIEEGSVRLYWNRYYFGIRAFKWPILLFTVSGAGIALTVFACREWIQRHWQGFLNGLIAVGLCTSAFYALHSNLTVDEWEHIHVSWNIAQGLQPLIDFFEHHHGLMWYLLAPLISWVDDYSVVPLLARALMLIFWLLSLLGTYASCLLITESRTASKTAVLLLIGIVCLTYAVEFRPDNPQISLGIWSLYFFLRYLKSQKMRHVVASGLCMGISFLFLQKALHLCAAMGCIHLYLAFSRRLSWTSVGIFTASCGIPVIPFALLYLLNGHVGEYVFFNWILNLSKISNPEAWLHLLPELLLNPFLPLFFFSSLVFLWLKRNSISLDIIVVTGVALAQVFFVYSHPIAWPHYFLPLWSPMAIVAGYFLIRCFGHHPKRYQALVLLYLVGLNCSLAVLQAFVPSNQPDRERIRYLQANGVSEHYVYGESSVYTAFSNDIHFFWFGFGEGRSYPLYKTLVKEEPYASWLTNHHDDHDSCLMIVEKRPKFLYLEASELETLSQCHPDLMDRYEPGPWDGLFQLRPDQDLR